MKNKDKITQCKFYFDLEKELKYINEMNKQGYKLVYIKVDVYTPLSKLNLMNTQQFFMQ